MYFVGQKPDLYYASVIAVMYAISCNIRPRCNSVQLYFQWNVL